MLRKREREGEFSTFQDHHQFSFGHQFLFKPHLILVKFEA